MPEPMRVYLMALGYLTKLTTCSVIADALESVSKDRLTRTLQGTWSGHLLAWPCALLFPVAGGDLIVDDTEVAQPYAAASARPRVWSNGPYSALRRVGGAPGLDGWPSS